MSDSGLQQPSWWNIVATAFGVLGAPVLLQKVLEHFSGRRKAGAESELALAQAREADARSEEIAKANDAEFEKALNARTIATIDALERQVTLLVAENKAQRGEIHELRNEVIELRKALDKATREIHELRANPNLAT